MQHNLHVLLCHAVLRCAVQFVVDKHVAVSYIKWLMHVDRGQGRPAAKAAILHQVRISPDNHDERDLALPPG